MTYPIVNERRLSLINGTCSFNYQTPDNPDHYYSKDKVIRIMTLSLGIYLDERNKHTLNKCMFINRGGNNGTYQNHVVHVSINTLINEKDYTSIAHLMFDKYNIDDITFHKLNEDSNIPKYKLSVVDEYNRHMYYLGIFIRENTLLKTKNKELEEKNKVMDKLINDMKRINKCFGFE